MSRQRGGALHAGPRSPIPSSHAGPRSPIPPSLARQASSSSHLPAFPRQWSTETAGAGDAPTSVAVRWLEEELAFSTLGGSLNREGAAASGADVDAVQALAARKSPARGGSGSGSSPEARPVVHLQVSFTFACVKCASPLLVTNAAASKHMVVECSACTFLMTPSFPESEARPVQAMLRRAASSIGRASFSSKKSRGVQRRTGSGGEAGEPKSAESSGRDVNSLPGSHASSRAASGDSSPVLPRGAHLQSPLRFARATPPGSPAPPPQQHTFAEASLSHVPKPKAESEGHGAVKRTHSFGKAVNAVVAAAESAAEGARMRAVAMGKSSKAESQQTAGWMRPAEAAHQPRAMPNKLTPPPPPPGGPPPPPRRAPPPPPPGGPPPPPPHPPPPISIRAQPAPPPIPRDGPPSPPHHTRGRSAQQSHPRPMFPIGSAPPPPPPLPPPDARESDARKSPILHSALARTASFSKAASKAAATRFASGVEAARAAAAPRAVAGAGAARSAAGSGAGRIAAGTKVVAAEAGAAAAAGLRRAGSFGRKENPASRRQGASGARGSSGRRGSSPIPHHDDCGSAPPSKPSKPLSREATPRVGEFSEELSEELDESDFSEDGGEPTRGQPDNDHSGRLSGGDFIFSL